MSRSASRATLSHRDAEEKLGRIIFHFEASRGYRCRQMMVPYGMTKTAQIAVALGCRFGGRHRLTVTHYCADHPSRRGGGVVEGWLSSRKSLKADVEKEFLEHVRPSSLLKLYCHLDTLHRWRPTWASELSSAQLGRRCERMARGDGYSLSWEPQLTRFPPCASQFLTVAVAKRNR